MTMYRQGDVLLRKIDTLPPRATRSEWTTRIVLAFGELTGHAHAVDVAEAEEWRSAIHDVPGRFLRVFNQAILRHEEHAAIVVPAGVYEIVQQREYRSGSSRRVAD